jgi:minor extracellular serine protease Vpr
MRMFLLIVSTVVIVLTPPNPSKANGLVNNVPIIKIPKIQISSRTQYTLGIPPLPPDTSNTVAIVQLQKPQTEREIRKLIAAHPDIKLRTIFHEALDGFSVEGPPASISNLTKEKPIITVSRVNEYHAEMEQNVEIIGGEKIRGYFDQKDNRLTGKGIKVGVIDTGIDYTHPDLLRSYGGGRDIVDNDSDPMETKNLNDPSKATLHGTHVAGIIAGNGKIQGVAPEATIIAYRALGPGGAGTTEQVLSAIEQAIKDKVDIMNLSLGNDVNGPDMPISLALNRAVDKGIVAVAAAGNSGPNVWTVGAPGTASKAISVGASTPALEVPYLQVEPDRQIRIDPMDGSHRWEFDHPLDIIPAGMGRKTDFKDIKGKIALIQRGGLTFTEKAKNAQEAGAIAVLIYNNTAGSFSGNLERSLPIPVGALSKREGQFLQKKQSHTARLNIIEEKDQLADFSSRGPVTGSWEIKPDLVAPGVAINSTIPGGYLALRGTSMAAPHVAGACALIKQAHPDWSPTQIKAALMNTAQPLVKKDQSPYRTYEQGAGRIRVDLAMKADSLVTPSSLQFGKFQLVGQENRHKAYITVENTSDHQQSYSFKLPAPTEGLMWKFPLSFTLEPKEKKEVEIELAVDPKHFKQKLYDGYLTLQEGSEEIQLPYIYVLEEPNYPRVMGFDFGAGDRPGTYRYEVYLPGGADEFGIALFDARDYRFVGFLDSGRNVEKGLLKKEIASDLLPPEGTYIAKVFAKKYQKEDFIETVITILKN